MRVNGRRNVVPWLSRRLGRNKTTTLQGRGSGIKRVVFDPGRIFLFPFLLPLVAASLCFPNEADGIESLYALRGNPCLSPLLQEFVLLPLLRNPIETVANSEKQYKERIKRTLIM